MEIRTKKPYLGPTQADKLEILRLGREKVAAGWIQQVTGAYEKPPAGRAASGLHYRLAEAGYVCALGGLTYGAEEVYRNPSLQLDHLSWDLLWLLYRALPARYRRHEDDDLRSYEMINKVGDWNDVKSRRKKEVLALFDRAIELVKEEKDAES